MAWPPGVSPVFFFIWLIDLVFLRRERLGCGLASRGLSRFFFYMVN